MNYVTPPSVLVVEDESDLRQLVGDSLQAAGFEPVLVATAAEAMSRLDAFAYDALVVDLRLPDADGMDVLDAATRPLSRQSSASWSPDSAASTKRSTAIKRGAIDFLIKPFQLGTAVPRAVSRASISSAFARRTPSSARSSRIATASTTSSARARAMRQVFSTLELVAPMNSTVLIHGETGTGKELIARTIHHNSPRADQRFVAFNAAAIPETLAEAELFGHVKGAFTGAVNSRVGRFELAHRGTLFIDEVGLMSLPLQAKLLRALQEREIERVGESRPIKFDVRIIAATNTDLRKMVKEGTFREDLFYRLNVIPGDAAAAARAARRHSAARPALRAEVVPQATTCPRRRCRRTRCAR